MLAAVQFLRLAVEYTMQMTPFNATYISNNKELIDRCNEHKEYNDTYPNNIFIGEFDVTEQVYRDSIIGMMRSFFEWVKGHQDQEKLYEDLDVITKLNMLVDHLAV